MASLEDTFTAACADGTIPGALMLAINRRGDFTYSKAFGVRSLEEGEQQPLLIDDVLAFFSCTKLITSIAVLQVVEQGLIGLDDDIAPILPELAKLPVLTEVRDGKPFLSGRKNKITLR
jgi:CubicO group peptidase (beta-lactamase class C family)